jgi:hypothetical protein
MNILDFTSEQEVINYAKVNGYDQGGIDELVSTWKNNKIADTINETTEVDDES